MKVTKTRSGIVTMIGDDLNSIRALNLLHGLRFIKMSAAKKQGNMVVTGLVNGSFSTLERGAVWENPIVSTYQIEF